jgi:hypothetical protein
MKPRNVKSDDIANNHNRKLFLGSSNGLKVTTNLKAGGVRLANHNHALVRNNGLPVKTG